MKIQSRYEKLFVSIASYRWTKKSLIALSLLSFAYSSQTIPETTGLYNLTIVIQNIKNDKGLIRLNVFNKDAGFPQDPGKSGFSSSTKSVKGKTLVTFKQIPSGEYAVAVIHDENNNGSFDMKGIFPREGFGSSNNPKVRYGPPLYKDSAFKLDSNKIISININYPRF